MKLYLDGHDYRFAVEQILVVLFPGEKPEYLEREPQEGDFASVRLRVTAKRITARTVFSKDGAQADCGSYLPAAQEPEERDRRARQVIRTSFFKAARQVTGISPEWGAMTGIRPAKVAQSSGAGGG